MMIHLTGSSSMASVCAGSLALMDAGITPLTYIPYPTTI